MADRTSMADVPPTSRAGRARSVCLGRRRDDRGATMAEAALVMPVFVLLLFGLFEFSGYIGAATGANAAVKAGARMATVSGDDPMADANILDRMNMEGAGLVASNDVVEEIKIWKAAGKDDEPPETCNDASNCNHYVNPNQPGGAYGKASLPLTTEEDPTATMSPDYADCHFGYGSGASEENGCTEANRLDSGWPPGDRRIMTKNPNNPACGPNPSLPECQPTDMVGLWIKVRHDYYTGFFGESVTVTSKTIVQIEPQRYDK